MQIKFDDNGYVIGYAELGGVVGGQEWTGNVPENFADSFYAWHLVGGELVLDEERAGLRDRQEAVMAELSDHQAWFRWYDNQCMQYQRAVRTGEAFDLDMTELDAMASARQLRIRELREEVALWQA